MREQERAMAPPHWNLYIAVASADDAAAHAAELGGKVVVPPFDVMSFGRMAVIMDPTGAAFCLWEPKDTPGTTVAGEPGTMCWADLNTPDTARAKQFYSALFGWQIMPGEHDTSGYLHIKNGDQFIGGMPPDAAQMPPHWIVYYLVTDCDASTAKVKQLGGRELMAPMTLENVGRFSVVTDPQGAAFSLFQPAAR
jgi:predicted enzyme related to lactoylglutathione lyase